MKQSPAGRPAGTPCRTPLTVPEKDAQPCEKSWDLMRTAWLVCASNPRVGDFTAPPHKTKDAGQKA